MLSAVVSVGLALLLGAAEPSPPPAPPLPPDEGLCLWLDAADQKTVEAGPDGAVLKWRNRVDGKSAASAVGAGHAALVRDAINGLPALRLDGAGGFVAPGLGPDACDVVAFVVFRQSKEQAAKAKGQPLLVALDAKGGAETGDAALKMAADDRPLADAAAPALYQLYRHEVRMGQVAIGCSGKEVTQGYCGDIAEVLIYDRKAAREDVILWACAYLARKWNTPLMLPRRNCLIFDSEVMKGWFGLPRAEDLPSTFYVDYVRAWKRQR